MYQLFVLVLAAAVPVSPFFLITVEEAPVTVELYYESFCPGCRQFITTQLFPTFNKLKDTGIMKVGLFPYGNAREQQLPDGSWKFQCQHGGRECQGNILEACIMNHLDWDSSVYMPVISCMEGADDPVYAALGCVRDLSKLNYQDVDKCAKGAEGNALMHQIAVKTEGLSPAHQYVPWIVVNGIHNKQVQDEAQEDLLSYVCKLYKGTKPKECMQQNDSTNHTVIEKIWRDYHVPQYQENEPISVEVEIVIN